MGGGPSTQGRFTGSRSVCLGSCRKRRGFCGDRRAATEQEPKKLKLMQLPCAGGIPVGAVGAVQRVRSSQLCTSKPAFQRESVGNHFCITAQYYVFTACKLPHVEKKTLE